MLTSKTLECWKDTELGCLGVLRVTIWLPFVYYFQFFVLQSPKTTETREKMFAKVHFEWKRPHKMMEVIKAGMKTHKVTLLQSNGRKDKKEETRSLGPFLLEVNFAETSPSILCMTRLVSLGIGVVHV